MLTTNNALEIPHMSYMPISSYVDIRQLLRYICLIKTGNELHLYLSCYKHTCASNKYAPEIPTCQLPSCADMRQLGQYINLIWSQYRENVTMMTGIPHYWYMLLNKYAFHISHVSHCISIVYRPHSPEHIHQKSINFSKYYPNYCKLCARNEYGPQIYDICSN